MVDGPGGGDMTIVSNHAAYTLPKVGVNDEQMDAGTCLSINYN